MARFAHGWLAERDIRAGARMRLFCLPHAGSGSAAFYRWKRELSSTVDVCPILLPGRETRVRENSLLDAVALVQELLVSTRQFLDLPFAFFGHSMGSLLAYEWAVQLAENNLPAPLCLFVSGRDSVHLPLPYPDIHRLSDEAFVGELQRRYGGTPDNLLADAELRELFLPILRADLSLVETYRRGPKIMLNCPILACAGFDDGSVSSVGLEAWRTLTTGNFSTRRFIGDHFYSTGEGQPELLAWIERRLR